MSEPNETSEVEFDITKMEIVCLDQHKGEVKERGRPKSKFTSEKDIEEDKTIPWAKTQLWYNDESGDIFDNIAKKNSWMSGFDSVAGGLKDGYTLTRDTKMHGEECYKDPYFNMMVAGVETIPETFDARSFRVGFYNNPIYCHIRNASERPKKRKITPEAFEKKKFAVGIIKALYNFNHPMNLIFAVSPDPKKNAYELVQTYKNKKLDEAEAELKANPTTKSKLKSGYFGNLENIIERASALCAIDRYFCDPTPENIESLKKRSSLVICYEDVEKAISFYERIAIRGVDEVLRLMSNAERKHIQVESYEKIYSEIKERLEPSTVEALLATYPKAMTYQHLYELIPSNYKKFDEYIQSATKSNIVVVHNGIPMKIGAPSRIVQLVSAIKEPEAPKLDPEASKEVEEALKRMGENIESDDTQKHAEGNKEGEGNKESGEAQASDSLR
jgi:hypothetical protein